MSGTFRPNLEVLPPEQRRLWPALQPTVGLGLTLYGGTAIALRLGHRQSVDFDFFTGNKLEKSSLRAALPFLERATTLQDEVDTLVVLVPDEQAPDTLVKVSFFGSFGFGRVGEPEFTEDLVLRVASLEDLLTTKMKVVFDRVEAKDYRDIAAMLRHGADLRQGLASAVALFGRQFQPMECLKALVYFHGGDLDTLSASEKNLLVSAVDGANGASHLPQARRASTSLS